MLTIELTDWAGGPGDSKEDVKWLDEKMAKFFSQVSKGGSDLVRGDVDIVAQTTGLQLS